MIQRTRPETLKNQEPHALQPHSLGAPGLLVENIYNVCQQPTLQGWQNEANWINSHLQEIMFNHTSSNSLLINALHRLTAAPGNTVQDGLQCTFHNRIGDLESVSCPTWLSLYNSRACYPAAFSYKAPEPYW